MSQFVVGQWVECVEKVKSFDVTLEGFYRVKSIREGTNDIYLEGGGKMSWSVDRFRPVEWQVGKTYKTTLEGVTATISVLDSDGDLWGNNSREHKHAPKWCWSGTTGILCELKDDKAAPHLTPYLAEPSPAVETTEASEKDRFTVEVVGCEWSVVDHEQNVYAPFIEEGRARDLCDKLDAGKLDAGRGYIWRDMPSKSQAIRDEAREALEAFWRKKASEQQPDPINPPRYQQHPSGVECIEIAEHMTYCVGNAIKYLWRAGLKGDALTDLRKAAWYVEREIQRQEKMKGGAE